MEDLSFSKLREHALSLLEGYDPAKDVDRRSSNLRNKKRKTHQKKGSKKKE